MRSGLTYWCPEGTGGGCGHVRIRGADTERFLLEAAVVHAQDSPGRAGDEDPVLVALRLQLHDLQDDHYDRLLDRADFVRQTERLRQRITNRRHILTIDPARTTNRAVVVTPEDPEPVRRSFLRQHLIRVDVDRHPRGSSMRPPPAWPDRAAGLARRLQLHWQTDDSTAASSRSDSATLSVAAASTRVRLGGGDHLAASSRWS